MSGNLSRINRLNDDRVIAAIFFVFAGAILISSYSYSYNAAIWPRFIAVCTMVGSLLILVQNQLPATIREIVTEDYRAIDQDSELREEASEQQAAETDVGFDPRAAIIATVLLVAFATLVLIVGYVVATVFFVLAYAHYNEMPLWRTIVILVVCLGIFFVVAPGLNIPLFEGLSDLAPTLGLLVPLGLGGHR